MVLQPRFWSKVKKSEDGCWDWTGSLNHGYGQLSRGRGVSPYSAHRLSYELTYGAIPEGLHVLHRCDNRRCVRPSHLFLGSQADNNADMRAKGRDSRGEKHSDVLRRAHRNITPERRAEINKKISDAQRGKAWTPEHLGSLRAAHAARRGTERSIPWNKGKPMSEETRQKVSKAKMGTPAWNKGRPFSEESRRKMSESKKALFARRREGQ